MPLSSNTLYGVEALTEAIGRLTPTSTIIRDLDIFQKDFRTTTYVKVANKNGALSLVANKPRGTPGEPIKETYGNAKTFEMLHLPKDELVLAEDVQNIKVFGSNNNQAVQVADKVLDKLAGMRADIEYTREHLMLGALKGKLMDADGTTELLDIYQAFGFERKSFDFKLNTANADISVALEDMLTELSKKQMGESITGWTVLASPGFMRAFKYHKSIKDLYARFLDLSGVYRNDTLVSGTAFSHLGIDFIQYNHQFANGKGIDDNTAIILPKGTHSTFREFFAPADMNATVNTKAVEYYASRHAMPHDLGWSLRAQSNPLPLVLRPELVATLTMS